MSKYRLKYGKYIRAFFILFLVSTSLHYVLNGDLLELGALSLNTAMLILGYVAVIGIYDVLMDSLIGYVSKKVEELNESDSKKD